MRLMNEYLEIEIANHGAELMRICKRETGEELLWHGDKAFWGRRSPVLFPNVGRTCGNVMRIGGESYPTGQHGFARDMDFALESSGETHAVYLLKDDEATRARYPHAFELRIGYTLCGKRLQVKWSVRNAGEREMAFTIGGHPAFNLTDGAGKPRMGMKCPGFPNYGIWSVPGAPFVCLEPWMGRCDDYGFNGEFCEKKNVNIAKPGEELHFQYEILLP